MSNAVSRLRSKGLSATELKIFAVVTMFIDHLTFTFLERTYVAETGRVMAYSSDTLRALDLVGRCIGRQAFPIFAFFIVEGFWHTHSRGRYLGRLSLFAVISQLPFHLMCYTGPVGSKRTVGLNVYATLAFGLAAIWLLDRIFMRYLPACRLRTLAGRQEVPSGGAASIPELIARGAAAAAAIAGICLLAVYLNTDYDYIGVIAIVMFYLLRGNRRVGVMAVWVWITWGSSLEFFALPGLLLLTLYNGERGGSPLHSAGKNADIRRAGKNAAVHGRPDAAAASSEEHGGGKSAGRRKAAGSRVSQYAFYVFYPVHMTVLWALRVLICGY